MNDKPTEITDENVLQVDIALIAQDQRFPHLTFDNSKQKLSKVQKWFTETEGLGFEKLLIQSDIDRVISLKNQLKEILQSLLTFDKRTTHENAQQVHDDLESQVSNYYNEAYQQLAMRILPFLRQETTRSTTDAKELEKQRRAAAQAQKDYENLKEQINKELEDIRARRSEVEKEQGEFVAIGLGKDFGNQADEYQKVADGWLKQRSVWLWVLLTIIALNVIGYFGLFILHRLGITAVATGDFFTFEYGAAKLALLLLLSYVTGFCSRNYNINAGLAATNRHRKNVAEVLLSALSSQLTDDAKGEIVRVAAKEMFVHLPVGYINKEHQSDSGPILEIIKRVSPSTSPNE